jgi:hypothetical protein
MDGDNLQGQLRSIRDRTPGVKLSEAVGQLKIESADNVSCHELDRVARRLSHVKLLALPDVGLTLHAPSFSVTLEPPYTEPRHYTLLLGENDLSRWCVDLFKAAVSCAAQK